MKILVTGGAGFIGSHIVDRLIGQGHEVLVVDNLISGRRDQVNPQATFFEADITSSSMQEIFERERPELLNHHAAQMDVRKSLADPAFDATVNILGLLNLMENGRKTGLKKVIFASSGGAISADSRVTPTPEQYPPSPQSPYGVSKLASEYYLAYYEKIYGIAGISLRYGNVYGPRQDPHGEAGVVAICIGKLLSRTSPTIFGDGEQVRDYVFVHDVVDANIQALESDVSGVFNIGTGVGTSVNALLENIQEVMRTSVRPTMVPPRTGEARVSVLDCTLAKEKLSWETKTSMEEGIKKTIEYFTPMFGSAK